MSRFVRFLALTLALPAAALAQDKPVVEIGTNLGVAIASVEGISVTHFGIPGQGILGQPTLYATFFAGRSFTVEPQVALNIISSEGETATTVGLGGQVGYLFKGPTANSAFLAGSLGFQSLSGGGDSESDFGAGGKVGYRVLVGSGFAIRFEGGYRRWFDSHVNEFTIGVGLGGLVHRRK